MERGQYPAARLFGLLNTDNAAALHLTDLGRLVEMKIDLDAKGAAN
jgi:hypothetical protein